MSERKPTPIDAFWAGYRQQLGEPTDVEVVDMTTSNTRLCLGQVTVPVPRRSNPKGTWS